MVVTIETDAGAGAQRILLALAIFGTTREVDIMDIPTGRGDGLHVPGPDWTCLADSDPWPCPSTRGRLRAQYAGRVNDLVAYLHTEYDAARKALENGLYQQIVGWIAPGNGSHDPARTLRQPGTVYGSARRPR